MPDINIQYYKANDLIMAEYNPRQLTKDQYAQLKDSLTRFGLVDPLIVNKHKSRKNILVGGHQRLKIAKEMGMDKIPCVEVDLPLDQEKELNIRLNKNVGEWDYDSLANYFDVSELMEWGFSNDELQFYEDEPEQGLIDDDEIPEVKEAITKSGDIWLLGEHRVLCGDSTSSDDVAKLMNGEKADMVFTDPPYGVSYKGGVIHGNKINTNNKRDMLKNDEIDIYSDFISLIPLIIDNGAIYIFYAIKHSYEIYKPLKDNNIDVMSVLAWVKINTGYADMNSHYKNRYEPFVYCKAGSKTNFIGSTTENTTWEIKKDRVNKLHPTQKPIEVPLRAIGNHKADIVADLFLGSGSTLIACEKTKRKCYGMEIDPHYCDVIVKRWEEFTGNKAERVERAES